MKRRTAKSNNGDPKPALKALRRAAKRAKELGVKTGTPVYVIQDHEIVDLTKKKRTRVNRTVRERLTRKPSAPHSP